MIKSEFRVDYVDLWKKSIDVKLAPRNKELYKNIYRNEFPSIKMDLFDAEFDSASNSDTFIHGKTIGKKFYLDLYFSSIHIRIGEKNPDEFFPIVFP